MNRSLICTSPTPTARQQATVLVSCWRCHESQVEVQNGLMVLRLSTPVLPAALFGDGSV